MYRYNISPNVSNYTQITQVISIHNDEYDLS